MLILTSRIRYKGKNAGKGGGADGHGTGPCFFCDGPHNLVQCNKWMMAGKPPVQKGGKGGGEPTPKWQKGEGKGAGK